MRQRQFGKSGFTLLELLVVVIIVAILASVAIPQYRRAIETSRAAEARAVLHSLLTAELAYYQENGTFTATLASLLVQVPVMRDWAVPTVGSATSSQCSMSTSGTAAPSGTPPTGGHSHAGHSITGTVADTGATDVGSIGG